MSAKKQKQLEKENLVMSGKQLADLLGVSMPKIVAVINQGKLGFPRPVKFRYVGDKKINYYNRQELNEFTSRVDLKAEVITGWWKKSSDLGLSISTKIDIGLCLDFFGANKDKLSNYGVACYDFSDQDSNQLNRGEK